MPDRIEYGRAPWSPLLLLRRNLDVRPGYVSCERAVGLDVGAGDPMNERGFAVHLWWCWIYLGAPRRRRRGRAEFIVDFVIRWGRHRLIDAARLRANAPVPIERGRIVDTVKADWHV